MDETLRWSKNASGVNSHSLTGQFLPAIASTRSSGEKVRALMPLLCTKQSRAVFPGFDVPHLHGFVIAAVQVDADRQISTNDVQLGANVEQKVLHLRAMRTSAGR